LFFFFVDDDDEKWLSKLSTCKWLKYVSKALHGAASLAKLLNFKNIELAGKEQQREREVRIFFVVFRN
jgi:hypothetical protein